MAYYDTYGVSEEEMTDQERFAREALGQLALTDPYQEERTSALEAGRGTADATYRGIRETLARRGASNAALEQLRQLAMLGVQKGVQSGLRGAMSGRYARASGRTGEALKASALGSAQRFSAAQADLQRDWTAKEAEKQRTWAETQARKARKRARRSPWRYLKYISGAGALFPEFTASLGTGLDKAIGGLTSPFTDFLGMTDVAGGGPGVFSQAFGQFIPPTQDMEALNAANERLAAALSSGDTAALFQAAMDVQRIEAAYGTAYDAYSTRAGLPWLGGQ